MRTLRSAALHVRRVRVGVREDGDALDAALPARADDADGDLAAVGDEHPAERHAVQPGLRFSRNARMPSWPSADTRCAAIVLVVRPMTSPDARQRLRG